MRTVISYSDETLDFIKANCTMTRDALTAAVNARFDTHYSVDNIKSLCKRKKWNTGRTGYFEKGSIPANKGKKMNTGPNRTSFKKGHKPNNWMPIGSERFSKEGYLQRKMTDMGYPPKDWVAVHRMLWEQHNGPIPKKHYVIFIDGDKTNIIIENLMLVSQAENAVINKHKLRDLPPDLKQAGITLGQIIHKTAQRKNSVKDGV